MLCINRGAKNNLGVPKREAERTNTLKSMVYGSPVEMFRHRLRFSVAHDGVFNVF